MSKKKYKDRGLIKWAPFDALLGIDSLMEQLYYNGMKTSKPLLSEDKINDINETITKSINDNLEILIIYFEDGYRKESFTTINKIDVLEEIIYTNDGLIIHLNDILDVNSKQ